MVKCWKCPLRSETNSGAHSPYFVEVIDRAVRQKNFKLRIKKKENFKKKAIKLLKEVKSYLNMMLYIENAKYSTKILLI